MSIPSVGQPAPELEMLNDEGKPTRLSDYRGQKVILYFYPKDFTSGCEFQACQFRDHHADISGRNAVVLGVSADGVESHQQFREALNLPFHLLVDADNTYSKAWGAYGERTRADGSTYQDIIRSQYVIDENGVLIDVQAPVNYRESIDLAMKAIS
ncbi:MAG: peroxiredoxin [Anaerolineae bacterium]